MKAVSNGLWNAAGQIVLAVCGMLASIVVVRALGKEGAAYDTFSYYSTLAGYIAYFGMLAFPSAITKVASELRGRGDIEEADALATGMTRLLVGLNLLIGVGAAAYGFTQPQPQRSYVLLAAFWPILDALASPLSSRLWSKQQYTLASTATAAAAVANLMGVLLGYYQGWGITGYLGALLLGKAVNALILLLAWLGTREAKPKTWPSSASWTLYRRFSWPLNLHSLIDAVVWQRSGVFLVAWLGTLGAGQIGYYNLSFTLYSLFMNLGWALINGFYPAISTDFGAGRWEPIRQKVAQAVLLATLYAAPLCMGGLATMKELLHLLYGETGLGATATAQMLFAGLLFSVVVGVFGLTLGAIGRPWATIPSGLAMIGVNLGLSWLLIPRIGALGAAIATTAAQVIYTLLQYAVVRKLTQARLPWGSLLGIVAIAGTTTFVLPKLVLTWLPETPGLVLAVGLGGLAYMAAIWGLGYVRPLILKAEVVQ
jgi:O-antigen/teichoic acid export membrane protein